jgi:hypothetical protein
LGLSILKIHLAPSDSIDSALVPKGRHTRSNPQLPLVSPVADPEKIMKNKKYSKKGFSSTTTSAFSYLLDSTLNTQIVLSSKLPLSSAKVSKNIDFEEFPVEYSTFETKLK